MYRFGLQYRRQSEQIAEGALLSMVCGGLCEHVGRFSSFVGRCLVMLGTVFGRIFGVILAFGMKR